MHMTCTVLSWCGSLSGLHHTSRTGRGFRPAISADTPMADRQLHTDPRHGCTCLLMSLLTEGMPGITLSDLRCRPHWLLHAPVQQHPDSELISQVSLSSLNRHAVATRADVGTPKATCLAQHFRQIVPEAQVGEVFLQDVILQPKDAVIYVRLGSVYQFILRYSTCGGWPWRPRPPCAGMPATMVQSEGKPNTCAAQCYS